MPIINKIKQNRLEKLKNIRKAKINPYPSETKRTHTCLEAMDEFDQLSGKKEKIFLAGRLRSIRQHGGSSFAHIEDGSAQIQIYFKKDEIGEEKYNFFLDNFDVGEFIEARGALFLTKKGEKTLLVKNYKILSKSLSPLPEKWHGLQDIEERFRKRYLDFIVNAEAKDILKKRSLIIKTIREFLENKDYIEIETPILQPIYGGGLAKPFKTHHQALDMPLYLRISDELYLKRLIVGGFEKVYEFCKDFRNEGIDRLHSPEFTLLEAMTAYVDYKYSMDLIEELYENLSKKIVGKLEIDYHGQKINLKRPWRRVTMVEAVKKETGVDMFELKNIKEAKKKSLDLGLDKEKIDKLNSIGEIMALIFEEKVEKTLIQPTIIYDYPVETSPLAKKCVDDPRFAERFEHFILGIEHSNNYSELNDPLDLKKRFIEEGKKLRAGIGEAHQTDQDFLEAVEQGMPPTSGIGIGIDRLVMLFTGAKSIKEVISFPLMRPKK